MSVEKLLQDLSALGVELWLDSGQLRYRGPQEAVSPALLGRLREAKAEIVARLEAEQVRPFPLTPAQRALWFLHRADPASPAYHIRFTVELVEGVDAARIEEAMQVLAQRHASLRTCFRLEDGEPVQFLRRDLAWRLRERRLSAGESPDNRGGRAVRSRAGAGMPGDAIPNRRRSSNTADQRPPHRV